MCPPQATSGEELAAKRNELCAHLAALELGSRSAMGGVCIDMVVVTPQFDALRRLPPPGRRDAQ